MRRVSGLYLLALAGLLAASYAMQPIAPAHRVDRTLVLDNDPMSTLLGVLCGSVMLPLVMVSATAPLVQGWFALIGHRRSSDPYFLYAASNAGSLLALLTYPFAIEPNLGLPQSRSLENRFSHPGGSGNDLRSGGVAIKPIATGVD